jgi:YtkA-like protein
MALRIALLAVIAAALAVPTAATAGGWATVGFDPPPEGLAPGEPWEVEMTILQHGRAPLDGLSPSVVVLAKDGSDEESFTAHPTGESGVYRAEVVFRSAGTWRYVVDDDFATRHSYPAVTVGGDGKAATEAVSLASTAAAAPPSAGDDGPNVLLALGAGALAALAAGLGAAYLQRRLGGSRPAEG